MIRSKRLGARFKIASVLVNRFVVDMSLIITFGRGDVVVFYQRNGVVRCGYLFMGER